MIKRIDIPVDFSGKSERCEIRLIQEQDREAYINVNEEGAIIPETCKQTDYYEKMWERALAEYITFSVFNQETGDYMGYINLQKVKTDMPEIGIELLEKYQRQGYGTELITRFLALLSELALAQRVFRALVQIENKASQKMFEKVGAVKIAVEERDMIKLIKERMEEMGKDKFDAVKKRWKQLDIDVDEIFRESKIVVYEMRIDS